MKKSSVQLTAMVPKTRRPSTPTQLAAIRDNKAPLKKSRLWAAALQHIAKNQSRN